MELRHLDMLLSVDVEEGVLDDVEPELLQAAVEDGRLRVESTERPLFMKRKR